MKILKIILAAIFILSAVPYEGHCDDSHSDDTVQHCKVVCHAPCCSSILPDKIHCEAPVLISMFMPYESQAHQDPLILGSFRPPKARS